jgi:predicted amidohydrolase YtcJ
MLPAVAVVLLHAHALTLSHAQPAASALAIVDGRFAYVGDDDEAARRAAGPGAQEIDLAGRTVVPGFNDAHVHFGYSITAYGPRGIFLHDPSTTKKQFVAAVTRASRELADRGWLFVTVPVMPDGFERAGDLDFVPRPLVVITERGGWLNTRGLHAAHLPRGQARDGFINGRELAAALQLIIAQHPQADLIAGARGFLAELARDGITSVQLMDEMPELFEGLRKAGELTARVRLIPFGYRYGTATYHSDWKGPAPEWVRVDGVKYYHDTWARIPRFELQQIFDSATHDGRRVVVHVLTHHSLGTLLDALERMAQGRPQLLHLFRFEHVDEATPADAERLARDGIMVCENPSMIPEWATEHAFPLRTLLHAGVKLCLGTDWVGEHTPRRPLAPLESLQLAVTHGGLGASERIDAAAALEAYTVGSAAAEGMEEQKGMLRPGMLADLVVLSGDPLTAPPDRIAQLQVLMTMVGGQIVYRRGPLTGPPPSTIGPPESRPPTIGPPRTPPPATLKKPR